MGLSDKSIRSIRYQPTHPPSPDPFLLPVVREGGRDISGNAHFYRNERGRENGMTTVRKERTFQGRHSKATAFGGGNLSIAWIFRLTKISHK
jgi:hypothetical protein